jgi:galactonate dehydratase
MKIARIESFCVNPRWIFVRIETDSGLVGWGESIMPRRRRAVVGAIADLAENITGEDPLAIEDLWQRMYRGGFFRGGPVLATAIAGIEQALWDIKGRHYGIPIHEFFGGKVRQKVRAYAWIGGDRPDDVVTMAKERVAQGFGTVKMNATAELHYLDTYDKIEAVVGRVDALRRECGRDLGIAVDFHGRVHRPMAKQLFHELEPFHLTWIEEPVLPENLDALSGIAAHTSAPIATGERLYSRWEFKSLFEARLIDVIQPDVSMTGIHELETIGRMAEAYDLSVAPHCPNGPICLAATLQVDACLPNVALQEYSMGIHYHKGYEGLLPGEMTDYLKDPQAIVAQAGHLHIPTGPGLGITINEEVVKARHHEFSFRDNNWRNSDGTPAEW